MAMARKTFVLLVLLIATCRTLADTSCTVSDTNFVGYTLSGGMIGSVADVAACDTECGNKVDCYYYTYDPSTSTCYVKSEEADLATWTTGGGETSGYKYCPQSDSSCVINAHQGTTGWIDAGSFCFKLFPLGQAWQDARATCRAMSYNDGTNSCSVTLLQVDDVAAASAALNYQPTLIYSLDGIYREKFTGYVHWEGGSNIAVDWPAAPWSSGGTGPAVERVPIREGIVLTTRFNQGLVYGRRTKSEKDRYICQAICT